MAAAADEEATAVTPVRERRWTGAALAVPPRTGFAGATFGHPQSVRSGGVVAWGPGTSVRVSRARAGTDTALAGGVP